MKKTAQNLRHRLLVALLAGMMPNALPVLADEAVTIRAVSKEARCPVCGMYPSLYPQWMAQVTFKDQETQAFDSPADLFRFLHNVTKYDAKHTAADIKAIYLTDYAKGGFIEAKRAFLVTGSSARGPMDNADLPAFNSKGAADEFAKANGGKVIAFEKITAEEIAFLGLEQGGHTEHKHDHHGH